MQKRSIVNTPEDLSVSQRPGWEGTRGWWLIHQHTTASVKGVMSITEFSPGSKHELHLHPNAEQVTYVISGSGIHLGQGQSLRQNAGEAMFIPPNEWHGFHNDTDETTIIAAFYGGVSTPQAAGFEIFNSELSSIQNELLAKKVGLTSTSSELSCFTVSSQQIVIKYAEFNSGDMLPLHRHPDAEEFFFILSGNGTLISPSGASENLTTGDAAYIPSNEWHGFVPGADTTTRVLYGYFGIPSVSYAGFDVLNSQ